VKAAPIVPAEIGCTTDALSCNRKGAAPPRAASQRAGPTGPLQAVTGTSEQIVTADRKRFEPVSRWYGDGDYQNTTTGYRHPARVIRSR